MPLIPRRPFWDLEKFFQDEFLSPTTKALREPRMDIYEDNGDLVAEVELPGVESEDIEVNVSEDTLRIKAKHEKEQQAKQKGYYKKELSRGFFRRAVRLPVKVEDEQVEASYEDGMLKVIVPKAEQEQQEQQGTDVEVK